MQAISRILYLLLQLLTLDFVPRGYLTRIGAALAILAALGQVAGIAHRAIVTGELPDPESLDVAVAALLASIGAVGWGVRRALEE